MFNINVGGVPEHFNYPWLKCIEENLFEKADLKVNWKDCPGGTGEMAEALDQKKIDLAIMLTEGSIKEIESGKKLKIIQKYIETPLLWGIHVDAKSKFKNIKDLKGKVAAISRYNSGSHLMTHVLAEKESWDLNTLKFKVCQNLEGAIKALNNQKADFLLWERFTTKPYVDIGQLRHLSNCPTPWPCFVIVAREDYYKLNQEKINSLLDIINKKTNLLKEDNQLSKTLAFRYNLKIQDVESWLAQTEWSQKPMKPEVKADLKATLKTFGIIS